MKKFFEIATVLIILCMVMEPIRLYASNGPTFTVGSGVSATSGGTVVVPITVSNNPGFAAVGLVATYDPNVLELTNVTAPVAAMPLSPQFSLITTHGTQWILLVNTNIANWNGSGTIINMSFNVKSNATAGNSVIGLGFTSSPSGVPGNANGDILSSAAVVSGSVNITSNNQSDDKGGNDGSGGSDGRGDYGGGQGAILPVPNVPKNNPIVTDDESAKGNEKADDRQPQSSDDVDNGDFIGVVLPPANSKDGFNDNPEKTVAYDETYDSTNSGIVPQTGAPINLINSTSPTKTTAPSSGSNSNFGTVPQTGVADIYATIAAMCFSFMATVVLCMYIRH